MTELEPIFLFGAGGHGRAVMEVIRRQGRFAVHALLDDDPDAQPMPDTVTREGGRDALASLAASGLRRGFVAVGNNATRELITTLAEAHGLELVTVIDPAAIIASDATVASGSVVMPMSFVGAGARIGPGAIINTSATIDHDCTIERFAHISVGVHLSGGCAVGARSFVGIGAVLGGQVTLGERVIVGAGAAVVRDIPSGVVAAGVPARQISSSP